jgi:hypothetical protein
VSENGTTWPLVTDLQGSSQGTIRFSRQSLEGKFSEVRIQECAQLQPLLTLDLRQVASIPSDRPQHLALQDKDALQRIQAE